MPKSLAKKSLPKRVARSMESVLHATFQLLMEHGLSGVSVDEVAKRARVAKTTIYRHWPTRAALLLDACSKLGTKFDLPTTGSFKGDVAQFMFAAAERLRAKNFSSILPSIIDAAERDPQIAALHQQLHTTTLAPLYAILERAKQTGHLPRHAVPAEIVAALIGPIFYRRWFSREPLTDRFIKNVINQAIQSP